MLNVLGIADKLLSLTIGPGSCAECVAITHQRDGNLLAFFRFTDEFVQQRRSVVEDWSVWRYALLLELTACSDFVGGGKKKPTWPLLPMLRMKHLNEELPQ